ncbi:MAG: rod shape-determining protein MreC [Parcubacteria group bacterium]|jgi:rod shape-determining protein MreC
MPQKYLTPNLIKFLAVAVICLLLIFINPRGLFNPVRGIFLEMAYPFQKTFYLLSSTITGTGEFLRSIGELKEENENLIRENNELATQIALLQDEKKENASLREQINLAPRQKFDLAAGFVIGQDPQRLDSWLMINKGTADGVNIDMPAIVSEGILIGKVTEVTAHSAKITLLSDSTSVVNVVDSETQSKGVLRGEYGLGVVMDMVSQQDALSAGDTVVTSGLGSDIPRGLLVGKIQEVRLTGDKLFQQAIVVPRIKYSKIDVVFVIKN